MKLWSKFTARFRREKFDAEMSEEMRLHLERRVEENMVAGMSPEEARYAALRKFGGVEQAKERCREARGWPWLEQWTREIRIAFRSLRRSPAFSAAVIATLALCLGPNAAVLSVFYTLFFKPLPFPEAGQLVHIANVRERVGPARLMMSYAQYADYRTDADLFRGVALLGVDNATLGEDTEPVRASGNRVSIDFFSVLDVQPLLGRFFGPEHEEFGNHRVLVLTQTFWETHYATDPSVIGRTVRVGGETFTILGVAPRVVESLTVTRRTHIFQPWGRGHTTPESRYALTAAMIGRLKPGISQAAGLAQLNALESRFVATDATPEQRSILEAWGQRIALQPLQRHGSLSVQSPLLLLQGGALFVLLIGCVNVVNLLLARANARRSEHAIRYALGAGRSGLARQMIAEALVLAGLAAVCGAGLAWGGLGVINRFLPVVIRGAPPVHLEPQVLVVIWSGALLAGMAVALLPFAMLWRGGLRVGDTRTTSASRGMRLLSSGLIVGQVAIALVLLVGAGLLIRSFARVMAVRPGFEAASVVQGRIALPRTYQREDKVGLQQRLLAAMQEIPGVDRVSLVADHGVAASFRTTPVAIRGESAAKAGAQPETYLYFVSPDFFATMGIPLREGRSFTEAEDVNGTLGVIVDERFVQRFLGGRSALGTELSLGETPKAGEPWPRIIGVAARANLTGLEARDGLPFVFVAINHLNNPGFNLLLRTPRPASDVVNEVRAKLRVVDPALPFYDTGTLQGRIDELLMNRRGLMLLLGVFSGLALLLAAVGLYGVLAYDVSQRTREIGIRAAVGATRARIVALILRQGLTKTGLGLALGLGGAFLLTRYVRGLLFDITPLDPVAFLSVSLLLLAIAVLASWLPARRAAKVDPMVALRAE